MRRDQFPVELLRPSILKIIKEHHPKLLDKKLIGKKDLDEARKIYFLKLLENVEENPDSREEIVSSLITDDFVADNINEKIKSKTTLGEKVSSRVASFFGSWVFIVFMIIFVTGWLVYNLKQDSIDPFPYALLGLLLTAMSAFQAPFILNSQNRQSDRDRLKFDEDFQTNIKSELEIRNLHSKIDHYNKVLWEKMEEVHKELKETRGNNE